MENHRTSQDLRNKYDFQTKWLSILSLVVRFITLVGVIVSVFFILTGIEETRRQSEINQKYIRCIILLPSTTYQSSPDNRAKAVDECAVKSKLPDGTHVQGGL